ncbi:hypothetical protein BV378_05220 [Nostoc sp. RF31YmG]|nr:hypothetical protein BV378_05220 [Nostoc sp. RF31YmG]
MERLVASAMVCVYWVSLSGTGYSEGGRTLKTAGTASCFPLFAEAAFADVATLRVLIAATDIITAGNKLVL